MTCAALLKVSSICTVDCLGFGLCSRQLAVGTELEVYRICGLARCSLASEHCIILVKETSRDLIEISSSLRSFEEFISIHPLSVVGCRCTSATSKDTTTPKKTKKRNRLQESGSMQSILNYRKRVRNPHQHSLPILHPNMPNINILPPQKGSTSRKQYYRSRCPGDSSTPLQCPQIDTSSSRRRRLPLPHRARQYTSRKCRVRCRTCRRKN